MAGIGFTTFGVSTLTEEHLAIGYYSSDATLNDFSELRNITFGTQFAMSGGDTQEQAIAAKGRN
jgi:hypothetical protein